MTRIFSKNPPDLRRLAQSAAPAVVPLLLAGADVYASLDPRRGHRHLFAKAVRDGHVAREPTIECLPTAGTPFAIRAVAHLRGVCLIVNCSPEHPMFLQPDRWKPSLELALEMDELISRAIESEAFGAATQRWRPDILVEIECDWSPYGWLYDGSHLHGRETVDQGAPRRPHFPVRTIVTSAPYWGPDS
jgi:hypothetical protein